MTSKINVKELTRILREEADISEIEHPSEIEAVEDGWSGGENLSLPIDIPSATGSEATVSSPETLSIVDDSGVFRMSESVLRGMVRKLLRSI